MSPLDTVRAKLADADHVLIGAGAGLSVAAGIDYGDADDFARTFPVLAGEGYSARYQMIGRWNLPPERFWAYWSVHVTSIRFGPRADPTYAALLELLAGKDVHVLTSNVDGMFERNGFDPTRIFTPQGDYANMQCRTPCRPEVWPSDPALRRCLDHLDEETFAVDASAIPRCPFCGGGVFLNVRADSTFVEAYRSQGERLENWLKTTLGGNLLVFDIGSGFNTPSVVRWPMERVTHQHPNAHLVRINRDHPEVHEAVEEKATSFGDDAGAVLRALGS